MRDQKLRSADPTNNGLSFLLIGRLSKYGGSTSNEKWQKVQTLGGKSAVASSKALNSKLCLVFCFHPVNGHMCQWVKVVGESGWITYGINKVWIFKSDEPLLSSPLNIFSSWSSCGNTAESNKYAETMARGAVIFVQESNHPSAVRDSYLIQLLLIYYPVPIHKRTDHDL